MKEIGEPRPREQELECDEGADDMWRTSSQPADEAEAARARVARWSIRSSASEAHMSPQRGCATPPRVPTLLMSD